MNEKNGRVWFHTRAWKLKNGGLWWIENKIKKACNVMQVGSKIVENEWMNWIMKVFSLISVVWGLGGRIVCAPLIMFLPTKEPSFVSCRPRVISYAVCYIILMRSLTYLWGPSLSSLSIYIITFHTHTILWKYCRFLYIHAPHEIIFTNILHLSLIVGIMYIGQHTCAHITYSHLVYDTIFKKEGWLFSY